MASEYTLRAELEEGVGGGMREEDGERERRGGVDLQQARGAGATRMRGLWLQHWMSLRPTFHMNLSVHITFYVYLIAHHISYVSQSTT